MKPRHYIALSALALVLAAGSFLAVRALLADSGSSDTSGPDTVVNFKLILDSPEGPIRHRMLLACKDGKPIAPTRGFNFDIPRQARVACRGIGKLPSGDYTCNDPADQSSGQGSVEGNVRGYRLKASFSYSDSRDCERYLPFWNRFQRLWAIQGGGSKQDALQAKRDRDASDARNRKIRAERERLSREMERKIDEYQQKNQEFIAPGSKPVD